MNMFKKPYEISLWDDRLIWHRRKLDQVDKEIEFTQENPYKRGKYYVEKSSTDTFGVAVYELSYEDYDEDETYYKLSELIKGNYLEGNSTKDIEISITSHSGWYENEVMVPQIITSFYKEVRLCTIGAHNMEFLARCVNPKLISKVNGENTLTFTMYYQYIDPETGEKTYNPLIGYLQNERKVKLRIGEGEDAEWYDFVIKQIQENSETRAFTYTCKDQHINELSKSGFEIELDNELENNMGTVDQLAETILEGSDWRVADSESLYQFIEEPLYKMVIKVHTAGWYWDSVEIMNPKEGETVPSFNVGGKTVYAFYSDIVNHREEVQILYAENNNFVVDDNLVIDKTIHSNYLIKGVKYGAPDINGISWPTFMREMSGSISPNYRGMRLIRQIRTKYDSKIDKYVQEYTKQGDTSDTVYYGFEETKYLSPNAVNNYIVNPNAFTNTTGWYVKPNAQSVRTTLELVSDPPFNADNIGNEDINFTSYLKFPNNGGALVNSSINSYKSSLEGFIKDKTTYVLRLKCKEFKADEEDKIGVSISPATAKIYQYENMDKFSPVGEVIFEFGKWDMSKDGITSTNEQSQDSSFTYYKAVCKRAITQTDLQNWDKYYGLFLTFNTQYAEVCVEDIQMFPYILDNDGKLCVPGGELFAKIETTKKYYDPQQAYSSLEEIMFEPDGGVYELKYAEGAEAFTKISSITAKESNRFNLLQELNEKFECWSRFRIERNKATGEILYGKDLPTPILTGDEAYRQQKFISFHEYVGEPNYVGFKYGINSKSIQRTIDSNAIVSKMIVKNNANEFAPNGFCSIARATENPTGENFILNFDHYIRHNFLDLDIVTNDLYVDANGYFGYYKKLKDINRDRDALVSEQSDLLKEIANYEASYQTYKTSYDSAVEEQNQIEDNIFLLIVPRNKREEAKEKDFAEIIKTYSRGWEDNSSYIKYTTAWMQCDNVIKQHLPLYQKAEGCLRDCENKYKVITAQLKEKAEQKRALNLQFYKKYSRFIQEGSWIKEDYVDDNLYYLDSLSTLHTSSQPKVTYNISVIDLSPLPEYGAYAFKLGDKTYIEDVEFFGWSLADRARPYREEIIVSEITQELDAPEKNSIKVQNYKTQFEDLFQRITAQTQQAEYHTGEYKRAANIVEPDGTISVSTLENSFANNSLKLSNVRDQSVIIDEYGITSTSLANPSEMVRIVNGGIFMSTDGGQSWKTGLTGYGLNSSYLTTGQINTNEIYIMNGNNAAFRWDEKGLSSYYRQGDYYDPYRFVRFDHNGIYGILADDDWTGKDEDIHDNASFALTWSGFSLKNNDGSVRISTDNDIQVLQSGEDNETIERIKIGRIVEDERVTYGIRIKDDSNNIVMETDDGGRLWLRDKLSIVGTSETPTVAIGQLGNKRADGKQEVIHAGSSTLGSQDSPFIVYEDGRVVANYIEVNGGKIGTVAVDTLKKIGYEVVIVSSKGTLLKEGSGTTLTATLYREGSPYEGSVTYQWYDNDGDIVGETSQDFKIEGIDFEATGYVQYGCKVTVS